MSNNIFIIQPIKRSDVFFKVVSWATGECMVIGDVSISLNWSHEVILLGITVIAITIMVWTKAVKDFVHLILYI